VSPSSDFKIFHERTQAVLAQVREVDSLAQALSLFVEITKKQGGRALAAPGLPAASRAELAALCEKAGLELLTGDLRGAADRIHTGVTPAQWGVAETGTIIIDSRSEQTRLASMLPLVHVALLPRDRIVPSLDAIAGELEDLMAAGPGYLAFITGPSRTADIERVLTIGVHGPAELHILILPEGAL